METFEFDEKTGKTKLVSKEKEKIRKDLENLRFWLDECIELPYGIKIGLDPIIGLIPGVGDLIGSLFFIVTLKYSEKLNVPTSVVYRMTLNITIDFFLGLIPILGDFLDIGFKAHKRNAEILMEYVDRPVSANAKSKFVVFGAALIPIGIMSLCIWGIYQLVLYLS
jgi:hypothetical protein